MGRASARRGRSRLARSARCTGAPLPTEAQAPGGERLIEVQRRAPRSSIGRWPTSQNGGIAPAGSPSRTRTASAGYPGPLSPETPWSILVGHDGVFKVLLLTLLDLPLERFWSFPFALASITIVEIRAGRPVLRSTTPRSTWRRSSRSERRRSPKPRAGAVTRPADTGPSRQPGPRSNTSALTRPRARAPAASPRAAECNRSRPNAHAVHRAAPASARRPAGAGRTPRRPSRSPPPDSSGRTRGTAWPSAAVYS